MASMFWEQKYVGQNKSLIVAAIARASRHPTAAVA